jgi:hypothetical protein
MALSDRAFAACESLGTTLFSYCAEIMIQEGDWEHQYATRWELWQQQPDGKEQKLMATTRLVNGWER